jgi:hypothetical protein
MTVARMTFRKQAAPESTVVHVDKPREPPVTYLEVLRFAVWGLSVALLQLWRDVTSSGWYHPVLSTDRKTHFFVRASKSHFPLYPLLIDAFSIYQ